MRRVLILVVAVISATCLAQANLLTNGDLDFLDDRVGARGNVLAGLPGGATANDRWDTFQGLPDTNLGLGGGIASHAWWVPDGAGIDVLDGGVIPGVEPHSGSFYVEPDSDTGAIEQCVGCGTNSILAQDVSLGPGMYLLSFYYRARPDVTPYDSTDFQVSAYVGTSSLGETLLVTAAETVDTGWNLYQGTFWLPAAELGTIWFQAEGYENEYGGLIDTVSLIQIPEPATYGLVGAGLIGLFLVRRRRRA